VKGFGLRQMTEQREDGNELVRRLRGGGGEQEIF